MSAQPTTPGDIVWHPTTDDVENAHLTKFIRQHGLDNFDELIHRSTSDIAWFTETILQYLNIEFYQPYTQVVDLSKGYAWPQWVVGGRMNIVHNCLDKYIGSPDEGQAVFIWEGELVIKAPWIGMTRGFWKAPQRYEQTYWSHWENVWVHGDFALVDDDGMWYILGRSDDTIKVAGKRIGPAEVESVLVSHPAVVEAAAIGTPDEIKGNAIIIFCVLDPQSAPSSALHEELKQLIISALGKPLGPRRVLLVSDLPKTRNAKVMRRLVRAAYLGEDPGDTSSLVNPEAVDEIIRAR